MAVRNYNGKRYYLRVIARTKAAALTHAKSLRARGINARVSHSRQGYEVWANTPM